MVGHHNERPARGRGAHLQDGHDVGVAGEPTHRVLLAQEAVEIFLLKVGGQHLDGDRAVQQGLRASIHDAKAAAERIVRELANGSQAAALNATQSRDAIAAFERLQGFYQASGRRVSLLAAVSEFVEAAGKLHGRTMGEAVEGYLRNIATVKSD